MKENTYKVLLNKEEMNVVRNGMNLILNSLENILSKEAKKLYTNVKMRFDMEYNRQLNNQENNIKENITNNYLITYILYLKNSADYATFSFIQELPQKPSKEYIEELQEKLLEYSNKKDDREYYNYCFITNIVKL